MIQKVLIANRGEIALRILRACKKLGIKTVAVHSTVDRQLPHVKMADESVCIGSADPKKSYLNIPSIISAAELTNADAIHPGYGFLSESAQFAEIVESNKFIFIGPPSKVLKKMGDKIKAKTAMKDFGVPCIPGFDGVLSDNPSKVMKFAKEIGFPIMLKAIHGGGGRGMMIVNDPKELPNAMNITKSEAENAFGNGDLYFERYFDKPRHIEIQVLCDNHGNAIHLGERDCSLQRRNQKVIEETTAVNVPREEINKIGKICTEACKKLGYTGAGTFEFLYQDGSFSFIEMNTRIQVEHPVSEFLTGIDLISEQILVASGEKLKLTQKDVTFRGHSIECRINAEDPETFMPSPGHISLFHAPGGPGVRVDSHIYSGYDVPPNYDSLIAKIVTHAEDRTTAIEKMLFALDETVIEGIKTNIALHKRLLMSDFFVKGDFTINTLNHFIKKN
ncbi:MAG: acetyl-CoA carboxylase biotin carboxylase subunit [Gammaproteobacteria bacterium]|mgnify:FL=1|jgi:acetyl-CoA carboxylase, biotin carboxylase subunit|nr:acetyl-CoA carboxylase biotin carboxylase subunit [Gammaproteobacteria bacterium]MBT5863471.1 acetyl-CoA carboxylase biotin carboxylase subunit [Gammaproteobacteria bacterium]|tara:strand:+ start:3799 stop:5142 length:1344 start_codon:yes stop_codon:yes gene_type:complete